MQNPVRKGALGGALAALAIVLIATTFALSQRPAAAANIGVAAGDFQFTPEDQPATVGDQVIFSWSNGNHTATAVGGQFDVTLNSVGDAGAYVFVAADVGTVWYYCEIHSSAGSANQAGLDSGAMVGRFVVTQADGHAYPNLHLDGNTHGHRHVDPHVHLDFHADRDGCAVDGNTYVHDGRPDIARHDDPGASPAPATGTGTVGGTNNTLLVIIAGLASLALFGGAMVAIRNRA